MVKDHRYCTGAFKAQILIPHKATIDFACDFGPRKQIPMWFCTFWSCGKSYRRSVLHRAGLAASSLPSPKYGSLRQAASACVQRLQADRAQSERKRPLLNSPTVQPLSPLAQRIREDFQIGENEVGSPERELLRGPTFSDRSPPPRFPCVKGFPTPAPLVFTRSKTQEGAVIPLTSVNEPVQGKAAAEKGSCEPSCQNCNGEMTPSHQCDEETSTAPDSTVGKEQTSSPVCLPLCHYCCHWGSDKDPVHYFLQCVCDDWPCTCWCYCTDAQLEHKKLVFPAGFGLPGFEVKTVSSEDRPKARALAEARTGRARPCDNPSCIKDFQTDNARVLGQQ